jgi:hypothetical protein
MATTTGLAPNNTFGSATLDVEYDQSVLTFNSGLSGGADLSVHNGTEALACFAQSGNSEFDCFNGVAYTVEFDNPVTDQVRVTVIPSIPDTVVIAVGDTFFFGGIEINGPPPDTIAELVFDDVVAAAAKAASNPSTFSIADTSLSFGFYSCPDNTCGDFNIIDQCQAGAPGCQVTPFEPTLPVELAAFSAVSDEDGVLLQWSTQTETNNSGFSIEHALAESNEFTEFAFVEGHGTTTEAKSYSYRAKGLDIGIHRFRLKQIDFDGAFEYSEEIEAVVELAGTHRLGSAYPNPFNPSTTFELVVGREQRVKIDIINALGQRVQRLYDGALEANKPTNFVFEASTLPTGLYFYQVIGENFRQTKQMLLVK